MSSKITPKKQKLHETHIRIPEEAYQDMKELAERYHKPMAWVVRLIITDSLRDAASYTKYADAKTGQRVMKELTHLNNVQMSTLHQIKKIGYNVNQIAHESHINRQAMMTDAQVESLNRQLDSAMEQYHDAAEQAGRFKWQL